MQTLEGLELASFKRRAAAIVVDSLIAAIVFVILFWSAGTLWERLHPGTHLNFLLTFGGKESNWYSLVYLTAYFTLAVSLTNGRPPASVCAASASFPLRMTASRSGTHLSGR